MFAVDEAAAAAIRLAVEESGELGGVVELRRRFPLVMDDGDARRCVRMIAGWKPIGRPHTPVAFKTGVHDHGDALANGPEGLARSDTETAELDRRTARSERGGPQTLQRPRGSRRPTGKA